jgi:hypothetical protein
MHLSCEGAKAALWLFTFSLRAPGAQLRDARAHVAALAPPIFSGITLSGLTRCGGSSRRTSPGFAASP